MDVATKLIGAMPSGLQAPLLAIVAFISLGYFLWDKHLSKKAILEKAKQELEIIKLSVEINALLNAETKAELAALHAERVLEIAKILKEQAVSPNKIRKRTFSTESLRGAKWIKLGLLRTSDFWLGFLGAAVFPIIALGHVVLTFPSPTRHDINTFFILALVLTTSASLFGGICGIIFRLHDKIFSMLTGIFMGLVVYFPLANLALWVLQIWAKIMTAYAH